MSTTWKVDTSLYAPEQTAQDAAVAPVVAALKAKGWIVVSADVTLTSAGVLNGGGYLSEQLPFSVWIQRDGSTQADAEADVKAAIEKVGAYSIARGIATTAARVADAAQSTVDAIAKAAKNIANQTDPNAPTSPVLLTVQIVAVVIGVAVVGFVAWKAITLAREVAT